VGSVGSIRDHPDVSCRRVWISVSREPGSGVVALGPGLLCICLCSAVCRSQESPGDSNLQLMCMLLRCCRRG
jgi:hypothetical protein